MPANSMDELVSLCKRRGFIFQSNEIYGGLKSRCFGTTLNKPGGKPWFTCVTMLKA